MQIGLSWLLVSW